ncbi:MAG: cyclic pyranopterin monophosphate synthase MoaC [Ruminiclostridium sp.]|nr:cyclic pyranopterin monophosphate synthase MoaC [Ruminiclostridium sp.]
MELTHIDDKGNARMVDVSPKEATFREAVAVGRISMKSETLSLVMEGNAPKGDVLSTARIAGIMAAKRTQELIPMCHNIPLDAVKLEFHCDTGNNCINIKSIVKCTWKTGVEMEALTAVSVAALTVYDMCKAIDREMVIGDIALLKKTGGKSGDYIKQTRNNE